MKAGQKLWTKDELILAINLYCKMPFGKMHKGNQDIKNLASYINRSPSAVARKLGNFASFDPTLQARGIKGLSNSGKLDQEVWNEFYNNWDEAILESEKLLAKLKNSTIEELNKVVIDENIEGLTKDRIVKTRVNQHIFRTIVLATYNNKCCITEINNPELLVASHIIPWSRDAKNRLNPMNGLCLNALHDKAFDNGLITIDFNNYKLRISSKLKLKKTPQSLKENFLNIEGRKIFLPDKFIPSKEFLKYHQENIFKK